MSGLFSLLFFCSLSLVFGWKCNNSHEPWASKSTQSSLWAFDPNRVVISQPVLLLSCLNQFEYFVKMADVEAVLMARQEGMWQKVHGKYDELHTRTPVIVRRTGEEWFMFIQVVEMVRLPHQLPQSREKWIMTQRKPRRNRPHHTVKWKSKQSYNFGEMYSLTCDCNCRCTGFVGNKTTVCMFPLQLQLFYNLHNHTVQYYHDNKTGTT